MLKYFSRVCRVEMCKMQDVLTGESVDEPKKRVEYSGMMRSL